MGRRKVVSPGTGEKERGVDQIGILVKQNYFFYSTTSSSPPNLGGATLLLSLIIGYLQVQFSSFQTTPSPT